MLELLIFANPPPKRVDFANNCSQKRKESKKKIKKKVVCPDKNRALLI